MSRDGTLQLSWPDQSRTYRLKLGELRQLEEKCGLGPFEILVALQNGRWKVDHVFDTVRLGMIGGGARMDEALRICELTIHDGTLAEAAVYAQAILHAAITGAPDEEIVGPKGNRDRGKPAPATAGLSGKRSTPKARSSDGRRTRSSN